MTTTVVSFGSPELDALTLPDGRLCRDLNQGVLYTALGALSIPGFSPTAGRTANLQAYSDYLASIGAAAATAAIAAWKAANNT